MSHPPLSRPHGAVPVEDGLEHVGGGSHEGRVVARPGDDRRLVLDRGESDGGGTYVPARRGGLR